ncbi:methyltransferase domain-containing protein [Amycolatopsis sp., V23-08]|uniref:Methyltransferase domain-containing protein n=1 Tax=Amycolatopsis heterodermiae TaxID=3110235 RepID=A0ABU5R8I0_9PSEU|nr:methyltransferase domain-containing protein [Amycolatopsis sp., V23-08]MEA5362531.1 methyltransferase domain-containing protein [Amycolatopsis sp., V23-08]
MGSNVLTQCRVCGRSSFRDVLDLGELAVSDFGRDTEPHYAPLALVLCDPGTGGCSFVQLKHRAIDRDLLYRQYWYRSGTNESMRVALASIAASGRDLVGLGRGDVVVDIGANDGTLLRSYRDDGVVRVGFEPAANLVAEARAGTDVIIPEYFTAGSFFDHLGASSRAELITSIAMFYDLENPHDFVRDIARILAPDGLWIIQMAYLPTMYASNNFDNICHEHVGYYSLEVMKTLLSRHGLSVRDVELNDVNGGSFRLYVGHHDTRPRWADRAGARRVEELSRQETALGLHLPGTHREFRQRIAALKTDIPEFVRREMAAGKVFHVYGASTKGNTILQYLGLDHRHFAMAAERSPHKWGLRTAATDIPIVSEDESRQAGPDYYFVLPWHFRDSFVTREAAFLRDGGQMIFPLPEPTVVRLVNGAPHALPLRDALDALDALADRQDDVAASPAAS